jgi:hypothetical protein
MLNGDSISNLAWVNLLDTWLVLETLPVSLDVIGGPWGVRVAVLISLDTELHTICGSHNDVSSCCPDVGGCIEFAS